MIGKNQIFNSLYLLYACRSQQRSESLPAPSPHSILSMTSWKLLNNAHSLKVPSKPRNGVNLRKWLKVWRSYHKVWLLDQCHQNSHEIKRSKRSAIVVGKTDEHVHAHEFTRQSQHVPPWRSYRGSALCNHMLVAWSIKWILLYTRQRMPSWKSDLWLYTERAICNLALSKDKAQQIRDLWQISQSYLHMHLPQVEYTSSLCN